MGITDEMVEMEIDRLRESEFVKLAKKEGGKLSEPYFVIPEASGLLLNG